MKNKFLAVIILSIFMSNFLSILIYPIKADFEAQEDNYIEEQEVLDDNDIVDEEDILDNSNSEDEDNIDDSINNADSSSGIENIDDDAESYQIEKNLGDSVESNQIEENLKMESYSSKLQNLGVTYRTHVQNEGWQEWKQNGEMAGTSGKGYRLEGINIQLIGANSGINIKYQVHVQNLGWQGWKQNGEMSGTSGLGYRLEAIKIMLDSTDEYSIQYRVHVENIGWQEWKVDGEMAGTSGFGYRLEAIQIQIIPKVKKGNLKIETPTNGSTFYNTTTSIKVSGWKMANVPNTTIKAYIDGNSTAISENQITYMPRNDIIDSIGTNIQNPTPGFEFTIDTLSMPQGKHTIKVVLYSGTEKLNEVTSNFNIDRNMYVQYQTHVENVGWQEWKQNGEMSGTSGFGYRLEGINIKLIGANPNINIKYKVHVQNLGWQEWKQNGEMAGTSGLGYRLEGIKILLDSTDEYSIQYRVHVENIGWQEWKVDGEMAGTSGLGYRLEAIQIQIIPKVIKGNLTIETPANGSTFYNSTPSLKISGWKTANIQAENTVMSAYIDDNSTPITGDQITYMPRNNIIEAIGTETQNPKPGFEFMIDTTSMEPGKHKVRVILYKQNTPIIEKTVNFYIDRNLHVGYKSYVQSEGWQRDVMDGAMSGTSYRNLRIEAMKIDLINAPNNAKIKYRTQIQNVGWQAWKENGQLTGIEGQGLRVEAIQIILENMDDYTVEYAVHIEGIGWTDWYIDGETAGTVGQSRRIEAIQIRLVPHYKRMYKGIDVSQFNGNIDAADWVNVKRSGVEFAMIRIGYRGYGAQGNFAYDSRFEQNIKYAKQAGIKVGIYFITQAITDAEAVEEAIWIITILKNLNITLDYPIALDIEAPGLVNPTDIPRTQYLDKMTRTRLASIFCQTIQNNGYIPMIYTNVNWATNYLDMSQLIWYDTWIAHYTSASKPAYNGPYTMWQYTSSGYINGISGRVDMNYCYKKY